MDKSNDGLLTLDELHDGLTESMGALKGNIREFESIIFTLDSNKNGMIDYSEFLAAACNK